jgi:UDP-N-acetylglucosamine:LPS N-acetylglucosamine transferase
MSQTLSPGRANLWAGKFAKRVAVSWVEAAKYFGQDKVAHTGNPVRKDIREKKTEGAKEFLKIEEGTQVVLILGGSQGAEAINEVVVEALPELTKNYAIVHQTGVNNLTSTKTTADVVLQKSTNKGRYIPRDYLNAIEMRMAAGAADVVVSRAGSTIFEIASWGVPSIIVPIKESNGDHQRANAFSYARAGACEVIEEQNLTANILTTAIRHILENPELKEKMSKSARAFDKPDAAKKVAEEILKIALSHEITN